MLKKVVITNFRNESIEYNIEGVQAENESGLLITSIDGLGPVKATINMTDIPTSDGSVFNSARLNSRNIVIKAKFTSATSIEEARHLSYRYFPVKSKVKIQVVTDTRTVKTEGYVESNEPDIFYELCGCQISIICPSAFFEGDDVYEEFDLSTGICDVDFHGDDNDGVYVNVKVIDDIASMSLSKEFGPGSVVGEMVMDFERMGNIVPNESPTEVPYGKCSFYISNEKIKYLADLPVEAKEPYEKIVSGDLVYSSLSFAGVYKKNGDKSIHIFSIDRKKNGDYTPPRTNVRSMSHYRMNHITHEWEKLPNPSFKKPDCARSWTNPYVNIIWIGCCGNNDQVYMLARVQSDLTWSAYDASKFVIFRLNEATDTWVVADECQVINSIGKKPELRSCIACSMNNRIYILYGSSLSEKRYLEFSPEDGEVYTIAFSGSNVTSESGASVSWGFAISKWNTFLVADESTNTLHVFNKNSDYRHITIRRVGENVSSSNDFEIKEIIDNNYEEFYTKPNAFFNTSDESGRIPFISYSGYFCWYKLTSEYSGEYTYKTDHQYYVPDIIYSSFGDCLEDIYYLVGCGTEDGQASPTYSERPTNTVLIDEDILTISTVKGEKGIFLNRHGVIYNIMNVVVGKIPWFTLGSNINEFTLAVNILGEDDEKVRISEASVDSKELFEGV